MAKLLLKLASAAMVPVVLWYVYMLVFPMYYMDDEYPYWKQQKDYVNSNSDYNDILILGDSTAKSDICTDLDDDLSMYNLAIGGATSTELYVSFRNYLKVHDKPKAVIMMFASRTLVSNPSFWGRTIYFNFFSWSELEELYEIGKELNDPIWTSDWLRLNILRYYFKDPNHYLAAVNNSSLFGRYSENVNMYEQVERDKGWMLFGTEDGAYGENYLTTLESFKVGPMEDYSIRRIIELCEENDIEIIVEPPPAKTSDLGEIQENVLSEYEAYLQQLQQDYPYALVNTSLAYYDNEYFGDDNHFNRKGAEMYTAEIIDKYFKK